MFLSHDRHINIKAPVLYHSPKLAAQGARRAAAPVWRRRSEWLLYLIRMLVGDAVGLVLRLLGGAALLGGGLLQAGQFLL